MSTEPQQTVSRAQALRARRRQGRPWTGPSGVEVVVRDLDIADHAVINQFPTNLQQMIYAVIERDARLRGPEPDDEEANPFAGLSGKEILEREFEIGTALCKAGWIDPQVVETVTDPDTQISIDEVDPADRRAYMTMVFGGPAQEARRLAPFPERPDSGVGSGSAVPAVPSAPESSPRPDAAVLRYDSV